MQGQVAIVTTIQAARSAAIAEAQRAATDQVLGAVVTAETQVANYELIRDLVVRRSGGLARLLKVDKEEQKNGIYTVTATFAVAKQPLTDQIRALLDRTGDPRVLVVLPETVAGQPHAAPTSEALIASALGNRGFRIVDPAQSEKLRLRNEILTEPESAQMAAARFGADLLIYGSAVAEVNTAVPDAMKAAGLSSVTGKLNVKLVDASTGQQLINQVISSPGTGLNLSSASQMAFERATAQVTTPLASKLIDWLAGTGTAARRTFTVRISGFPSYRAYSTWLSRAKSESLFSTVTSRAFDVAGTEVQVEFGGSPDALADLLEGLQLTVTSVSGAEVRAQYRP
ncbi:hypothetical protein D3875_00610 [Deinococcus cavernae]|uniref:Uncharacterized protein n=1 Tax=Deinococcus cavernae TaxID=2320857 RepID=A0A418VHF9_9DEIO|nr:hypothetical protein D3875_00610 [Deinococcus cavernae]